MHMLALQKWRQWIRDNLLGETKEEISTKSDTRFSELKVNQ